MVKEFYVWALIDWGKLMAIEIGYAIKARDISFDLLLLFPGDAMSQVYSRLLDDSYDTDDKEGL